jgi:preprotein translocase subunit SecF
MYQKKKKKKTIQNVSNVDPELNDDMRRNLLLLLLIIIKVISHYFLLNFKIKLLKIILNYWNILLNNRSSYLHIS